jgi:low affinity Fe/Cu permease
LNSHAIVITISMHLWHCPLVGYITNFNLYIFVSATTTTITKAFHNL